MKLTLYAPLKLLLWLLFILLTSQVSTAQTVTQTFNFTGGLQTWNVPPGVTSINIDAAGGQGGAAFNGGAGGLGGRVQATYTVTPGQTLNIYVGGAGQSGAAATPIPGGFNGGGQGTGFSGTGGGSGGGATDIRIGGTALTNRIIIAGGGGGAGQDGGPTNGGAGGGLTGGTAAEGNNLSNVEATGGTQIAGGNGGSLIFYGVGSPGALGQGGNGGPNYGGGGGGGYYGGGGGEWAGGGGGSSYTDPVLATNVTHTQGFQSGNGYLIITYSPCFLPTYSSPFVISYLSRQHTITNVNIAGSGSSSAFVSPGQSVSLSFTYNIVAGGAGCPGCVTQSYVGIKDFWGECIQSYGGFCNCTNNFSTTFTAPTTPGVYYFTLGASWLFNCGTPNTYVATPNGANEFAAIVVRDSWTSTITDETCVGDADGALAVNSVYNTPGTSYLWSTGATTNSITGLSPGTYTVTSADSYGCSQIDNLTVGTDVTRPVASATNSINLSLNAAGSTTLNVAAVDAGSSDACPITREIGQYSLNGLENDYRFLGNYNGHAYFISNSPQNYNTALTNAAAAGGYLATINSQAENDAIFGFNIGSFPFIGLNDIASEGVFVWQNAEPVLYTNWTAGEPNNTFNEDCVQFYNTTGGWNDVNCANNFPALIEFDTPVPFGNSITFTCADTGINIVVLRITDQGGLTDFDTTMVNISDNSSPTILTQNITIYLDAQGEATINGDTAVSFSADNCQLDTIYLSQNTFTCADVGTNNITVFAEDLSGNVSSSPVVITVLDTIPPALAVNHLEIFLDGTGNATITAAMANAGSSDSCGVASVSIGQSNFTCADIGLNRVNFIATDIHGNTDSTTFNVLVHDTTTQVLNCIADTTLFTPFDSCSKAFSYQITSNSICGDSLEVTMGLASGSVFPLGITANSVSLREQSAEYVWYDFENLGLGAIDGQDNWSVTGNVAITQAVVQNNPANARYAAGQGLNVPSLGGGNRLWMTRINDAGWSLLDFDSTDVITIEMDVDRNFWGNHFGIGFDQNSDGDISNSEFIAGVWTADLANDLRIAGPGRVLLGASNITYSQWMKLRLVVDLASKTASLSYMDLTNYSDWQFPAGLQNIALGFDYSATNQTNPTLANGIVYFHEAGNESNADNFLFGVRERNSCNFNVTVEDNIAPVVAAQNLTLALDSFGTLTVVADTFDNGTADNCTMGSISIDINTFDCSDIGSPINIIFTATDSVGNTDTAHITATIIDNIGPEVLTQPLTVYLGANGNVSILPTQVNNGSWDSCGIDSIYLDIQTFTCANLGPNTVTLFVSDVNGNISSNTATVTVIDTVSPQVFAQNATVYLDAFGSFNLTPAIIDNGSWDSCGIILSLDTASLSCANIGTPLTVTLTGTDGSGNTNSATATVTVLDTISPTVITQNITAYLSSTGAANISVNDINNGSWDSCGIDTLFLDITTFDCNNIGPNTVTLTVEDINGNISTSTAIVNIEDTVAPIAVAQNITLYLDSSGAAFTTAAAINNGSSDTCGIASISLNDSVFGCLNVGAVNQVVLTVTDFSGNTDTAHAIVTVLDTIAPTIVIQNSFVYLDSFGVANITPALVDQGTWDSCGIAGLVLDTAAFDCAAHGDTIITEFKATDVNGNISSQLVSLFILDTIAPQILTQDITIYLDSFGAASITPNQIDNGTWDSCGVANLALNTNDFNCGSVGINVVTLSATDIHGNTALASANVTVIDTIAPHIMLNNITVQLDSNGEASINAAMADNGTWDSCGIASLNIDSSDFTCANVGAPLMVMFTATDVNGNISIDSFQVIVQDLIAPTILAQNLTVWLDSNGNANITASQVNIGTWDSCGIDSIWLSDTSFTCLDTGLNNVLFFARDIYNNTDSQIISIVVLDTIPPVVLTQNLIVFLDSNGQAIIDADSVNAGSFDNCAILTSWLSRDTFDCVDTIGLQTITLYVEDASGNIDSALANITVIDSTAPFIATQDLSIFLDSFGFAAITAFDIDSGSTDNCSIDTLWLDQYEFDCSDAALTVQVTLYVRDISGNVDSATANVSVFDTIAPQPLVQNIVVYLDSFGVANILPDTFDVGTWDSCGIAFFTLSDSSFNCADTGVNVITFFAEDIHGNMSSTNVLLTVFDTIAPTIIIQDLVVYLNSEGVANIDADSVDIGTWDSCGVATISIDSSSFSCANHGDTLEVLFTAIDIYGNSSTDTSIIIILDTLAPNIFIHNDTFYLDSNGSIIVQPAFLNDSTSDNCAVDSMYLSDTLFTCSVVDSTFDITFFAQDIHGNVDSAAVTLTILDTLKPIITCNDSIVVSNDPAQCGAVVGFNFPTAWDNCAITAILQTDSTGLDSGSFFPVGITILSYIAIDQSGNTDSCSFVVEVIDTAAPVLFCLPDTQICDTTFIFDLPAYTDNCTGFNVTQIEGIPSGQFYPVGLTVNTFSVTDSYGNSDTCSVEVFRFDFPSFADAGADQEQCEAFATELAGNLPGVGIGIWSLVSGTGDIADSLNPATGVSLIEPGVNLYEWRIENGVCPIERDTVSVTEFLNPGFINAGLDLVLCDTFEATLSPVLDTIGTGTWLLPNNGTTIADTSIANALVQNLELGTYTYTWKVVNGVCPVLFDDIQINVVPYPIVTAADDSSYIFSPATVELSASSTLPVTYLWSPTGNLVNVADSIVLVTPSFTTTYVVRGETENGCAASDTVTVVVNEALDLPTAFTPDGDGFNDVWNIKELENYPNAEVKIYNRWGHLIYETVGYTNPWDGTFKGEPLPSGSYFFVIELGPGKIPPLTGSITIIK